MLTGASAFESCPPDKMALQRAIFFSYAMNFFVYILYSEKFDRFYIGQTNKVDQRVRRHNAGAEKATAPYIPRNLVWFTKKESHAAAMVLEKN